MEPKKQNITIRLWPEDIKALKQYALDSDLKIWEAVTLLIKEIPRLRGNDG